MRWRRAGTLAALVAVATAVGSSLGGSTDSSSRPRTTRGRASSATPDQSGLVRNATAQADWKPYAGPVAAHTIHHLDLTTLDAAQLKDEVAGSRQILHREYGVPVANFCYPAGRFDDTVIAAVEAAGYTGATTEIRGYATRESPFELARFEILGSTGVSGLAEDLSAG